LIRPSRREAHGPEGRGRALSSQKKKALAVGGERITKNTITSRGGGSMALSDGVWPKRGDRDTKRYAEQATLCAGRPNKKTDLGNQEKIDRRPKK